jgi:UPF0716 protein FxsA
VNPWVILLVVVYPVLEWLAASWLAAQIGWGAVLLVVALLVLVGAAVMRRAGFAAARSLRPVQVDGTSVVQGASQERLTQAGREVGDAGTVFVAGLLIALPGLITSAAGLVLLVPPVRRWVRSGVARSVRRRAEAAGVVLDARATTTTVQGSVLREDARADPDQRPIRGEIISGEIVRPDDGPQAPSS